MALTLKSRTEKFFKGGSFAEKYDAFIKSSMPYYDATLSLVAQEVASFSSPVGRVLDLGSGTGNFGIRVAQTAKAKELYLVDHSRAMLAIAREKTSELDTAVSFINRSFAGKAWTSEVPRKVDTCLSFFALDHIWDDRIFVTLALEIKQKLKDGGVWLLGEKCCGVDPQGASRKSFEKMIDIRFKHAVTTKLSTLTEAKNWRKHILTEDCVRPLRELLGYVSGAGFNVTGAWGVPLPPAEKLTEEWYYKRSRLTRLNVMSLSNDESPYGVVFLALTPGSKIHEELDGRRV